MRALIVFFIGVFLLASCNSIHPFRSNYKFKTVKAKSIDATANLKSETVEDVISSVENVPVILEYQQTIDTFETHDQATISDIETREIPTETTSKLSQKPNIQLDEENPETIKYLAIDAEERGKKSRNLGIAGLILSFVPFLGLVGLIFSIISLSNGIKGLRSRYITEDGLRWAKTGVVLSSISLGLRVLAIILIIVLFALL